VPDRWRRFTILDAAILVASTAIGLRLAGPEDSRWWMGDGTQLVVTVLSGVAIGGLLAGPTILAYQWVFLKRRERPGRGEALGLASFALWLAILCTSQIEQALGTDSILALMLVMAAIPIQGFIALVGAGYLSLSLFSHEPPTRIGWTDILGPVAAILVGLWAVADIATGISQL
jgi:hypothetical protein